MTRTFESQPAVREAVPLLLGLVGPSGGGKTYSALRLAKGIQRVSGGDIYMIDTEARRGLHYAEEFDYQHVPFGEPFGPLDYLAAIDHCSSKSASVVIVDSMSHEWEGPGGVLDQHEAELTRMAGDDWRKRERCKFGAWIKPKRDHQRMKNSILQRSTNFIFCFRAKEKVSLKKGKDPVSLGWMPIASADLVFEFAVSALLLPGAMGVPAWSPEEKGEREMVKLPGWARAMFKDGAPLDEDTGELLARWSAGAKQRTVDELLAEYKTCNDEVTFGRLRVDLRRLWADNADRQTEMKEASEDADHRVKTTRVTADCGDASTVSAAEADVCPDCHKDGGRHTNACPNNMPPEEGT